MEHGASRVKTQAPANTTDTRRAEAQVVIDILNRWDARMKGHQTQKRAHERVQYSVRICVYLRDRKSSGSQAKPGLTVWSRNISAKGIGFIYKGRIEWKRVLICLDPDAGGKTWMHAEIVRSRHVHNDFWEYGARFIRRATCEDTPAAEKDGEKDAAEKETSEKEASTGQEPSAAAQEGAPESKLAAPGA